MSWGTDFNAEVYLNRMTFHAKWKVEEKIKELEKEISDAREMLLMLAIANPNDIREEGENIVYLMRNRVEDQLEAITSAQYNLVLLGLYLEEINESRIDLSVKKED